MTDAVRSPSAMRGTSAAAKAAQTWWIFLVSGSAWLLFSILVFRFDWTTVASISILFGISMFGAAATELLAVGASTRGWKLARIALAIAFGVIGIVSLAHPGGTFKALAAVMSFYFVIKGTFELVVALSTRREVDLWWLNLIGGIALLLLGFWAAGDFGHKTILLVVWVGATALMRGISEIMLAFSLRSMRTVA